MSQQSGQSLEIEGVTYEVRHLLPDDALRTLVDVTKMGGGMLLSALAKWGDLEGLGRDPSAEPEADAASTAVVDPAAAEARALEVIAKALGELVAAADAIVYLRVVEAMMRVTSANGQPMFINGQPAWKLHFQGRLGALRQVVTFALKVNFADFFGGGATTLTSALGLLRRPKGSAPSAPPPT